MKAAEGRIAELENAVRRLRQALIHSNMSNCSPQEQGWIAQAALNATWDVVPVTGRSVSPWPPENDPELPPQPHTTYKPEDFK